MSITYNLNIPFSTHNPSADQPLMEANTNATAAIVGVDHVGFNVTGPGQVSGQHNQVTFNANNVPTPPTAPPVLFTNTVGSYPQLFFYSGNTTNQYVNGTNGSTYLLGGIILKWGTFTCDTTKAQENVTMSPSFPGNCLAVVVSINSTSMPPSNTTNFTVQANSFMPGQFTLTKSSASRTLSINYVAIGY